MKATQPKLLDRPAKNRPSPVTEIGFLPQMYDRPAPEPQAAEQWPHTWDIPRSKGPPPRSLARTVAWSQWWESNSCQPGQTQQRSWSWVNLKGLWRYSNSWQTSGTLCLLTSLPSSPFPSSSPFLFLPPLCLLPPSLPHSIHVYEYGPSHASLCGVQRITGGQRTTFRGLPLCFESGALFSFLPLCCVL